MTGQWSADGRDGRDGRDGHDGQPAGSSALARICAVCLEGLPVNGVAVTVISSADHRMLLHATDDVVARLEDLQSDLGEGPGLDALVCREAVIVDDLGDLDGQARRRWPAFTDSAMAVGACAVFAFPLVLGAAQLGVLFLYCDHPVRLASDQIARALALADAAFYAALDVLSESLSPGTDGGGATSEDGWSEADVPFYRSEVYQAAGMLMAQLEVGIAEATVRLRGYAFAAERPVVDVARDIVARRLQLTDDNDRGPTGSGGTE